MPTIDNVDTLSDDAQAQLASLQHCDAELKRLQANTAALQTARIAYAAALKKALPVTEADASMLN